MDVVSFTPPPLYSLGKSPWYWAAAGYRIPDCSPHILVTTDYAVPDPRDITGVKYGRLGWVTHKRTQNFAGSMCHETSLTGKTKKIGG